MEISFSTTFFAVMAAYVVMFCGPLVRRLGWLIGDADTSLLKIVVNLLMPCLIASKVLQNDVFRIDVSNLYTPPILGFIIISLGIGLGFGIIRLLPQRFTGLSNPTQWGTFAACVGMLNYGYVPIPLIADLYPNDHRLLAVLFATNLGTEFALWTVCVASIRGRFDRTTIRSMFSIPTIAIIVCIFLNVTGIDRFIPAFFFKPATMLGEAAIPLSLLFVGATLGDHLSTLVKQGNWGKKFRLSMLSIVLRLLLFPALTLLLAAFIPMSHYLKIILVIYASMASAIFPVVLTKLHGGDMETALTTILSNSMIALLTTPLWIAFGLKILHL